MEERQLQIDITGCCWIVSSAKMGTANTAMRSQSVETGMLTFYFVAMLFTDAVIVLAYYKPEYQGLLNDLVVEDSFYEFGTVLFLFIAAALGLSALWRKEHYRLRRRDKTFLFCVAFLLFVAAMEELNWGQRIFDFEVTYVMERARGQVNLHNLSPPVLEGIVIFGTIYTFFIIMPLVISLFHLDQKYRSSASVARYIPPVHIALVFLCGVSIHSYRPIYSVEYLNISLTIVCALGLGYLIFVRKVSYTIYTSASYFILLFSVMIFWMHGEVLISPNEDSNPYEISEFVLGYALLLWLFWYCRRNREYLPADGSGLMTS